QEDDIRSLHEIGELADLEVPVVELDDVGHAPVVRSQHQTLAVLLAVALEHLGMRLANDEVTRSEVLQAWQRVDRPLDALARPQQPPGEDEWAIRREPFRSRSLGIDRAMVDTEAARAERLSTDRPHVLTWG